MVINNKGIDIKNLSDEEFLIEVANGLEKADPMHAGGNYIGISMELAKIISERLRDISEKI